jgi:HK97 family phage portal protein
MCIRDRDDSIEHPIINLIKNPSSLYVSSIFWSFIIQDYKLLGNAYVRKIRVNGKVVSLQYLPSDMVAPYGDTQNPIQYWTYTVDGKEYKIENKDLIHFRYGRDPKDLRLGRSPVASVLREIATDNYASSTAFGLMKNGPIPAMILGPDANDLAVDISPDDAKTVKRKLQEDFTADNAGQVAVMTGPYKMDRVSWSPEELTLDTIRRLPEERITAALGINAMVLGLGAGLERSTYQNYERSQQQAWEDGMIPLLKQLAEVISFSLMYEYPETREGDYFEFDVSNVRALADDLDASAKRAELLYTAGIATLEEAKLIAGLTNTGSPTVSDKSILSIQQQETVKAAPDSFVPTDAMSNNAKRALAWKDEGFDGGTAVGFARAHQLVNKENLSFDTVVRMYSFFSRHEVDKKATGFNSGEEGFPSNGRVAWDLWGGDAGFSWSRNIVNKYGED